MICIDMDMPKSCLDCGRYTKFYTYPHRCYFTNRVVDSYINGKSNGKNKHPKCPLKECK